MCESSMKLSQLGIRVNSSSLVAADWGWLLDNLDHGKAAWVLHSLKVLSPSMEENLPFNSKFNIYF